ncbi:hypothetical protein [Methylobacterium mesophilicum]|uniref:hypothetical protein n=1 Tax=Methylobacterium mesophilicum TaxID=39956 RepID=UPI002F303EF2
MAEHDPCRHEDPIWYDRIEPDEPPGWILDLLARAYVLIGAGLGVAGALYWLPTRLWCQCSHLILRCRSAAAKRS